MILFKRFTTSTFLSWSILPLYLAEYGWKIEVFGMKSSRLYFAVIIYEIALLIFSKKLNRGLQRKLYHFHEPMFHACTMTLITILVSFTGINDFFLPHKIGLIWSFALMQYFLLVGKARK